ncbi:MAG: methyltransferase domain-containing protein, partial [Candidatus Aenigmarchaeota archaeon]|nr:methyltransferase domain-containing protein [Candidatus Aenigmarchaeota archaeon]
MTPIDIIKKYSEAAKDYESKTKDSQYIAYKKMAIVIINELKIKKAKILDLGCGTGLSSVEFFKKGYEITGIDITPKMIEEA